MEALANMSRRGAHLMHAGTPALLVQHAICKYQSLELLDPNIETFGETPFLKT